MLEFRRAVLTLLKPKPIGCISSDSGSIALVDPSYLEVSETGDVTLPDWNRYTAFNTEIGDGEFMVYEQRDYRGRLCRIIIEVE